MAISQHASTLTRIIKLAINIVVYVLYRAGDEGHFVGLTYNQNHDAEILGSGIMVGFLIYNLCQLDAIFLEREKGFGYATINDTLMNFVGFIVWLIVGGVAMQFWLRFIPENHQLTYNPSVVGISMSALSIINSGVYLGETYIVYTAYNNPY